ncbi:MAG: exo-alpha-sialidase, partial [Gemmatimonadetes bacterium]|nr:exo-alpha-sialidase [Gemmatimonadota bacterium]
MGTLLAAGVFLGAARAQAQDGVTQSRFIYTDPPTPQCHASTIVETPTGMVAAWFGGEYERHPLVQIFVSRHEGGRWTTPVAVADGKQPSGPQLPTWNPVLFQPRGGPLTLYYKVGPSPSTWWGMVMTSPDNGRTWSSPQRLPEGVLGPIKNKPVQLADGTIVSGSSTENDGWRLHFELSHDQGRSWLVTGPMHDP